MGLFSISSGSFCTMLFVGRHFSVVRIYAMLCSARDDLCPFLWLIFGRTRTIYVAYNRRYWCSSSILHFKIGRYFLLIGSKYKCVFILFFGVHLTIFMISLNWSLNDGSYVLIFGKLYHWKRFRRKIRKSVLSKTKTKNKWTPETI